MVLKLLPFLLCLLPRFENDVKVYGTETNLLAMMQIAQFENDVKVYGTETWKLRTTGKQWFENDVKHMFTCYLNYNIY